MFLEEDEQQQSRDSFHYTSPDLPNQAISRDELSEIMTNMSKTLHRNTPEQTVNGIETDDDDDDDDDDDEPTPMENKSSRKPSLIDKLETQLVHNQMRRTQARDYTRILCQSNKPAVWYKSPPAARSVYFYDPNFPKYVDQCSIPRQWTKPKDHSATLQSVRIPERLKNPSKTFQESSTQFTPRLKYMVNIYHTAVNHHQKKQIRHPTSSSVRQLQSISTLPPISTSNQRAGLSNSKKKRTSNHQSILVESNQKFNRPVMSSTLF